MLRAYPFYFPYCTSILLHSVPVNVFTCQTNTINSPFFLSKRHLPSARNYCPPKKSTPIAPLHACPVLFPKTTLDLGSFCIVFLKKLRNSAIHAHLCRTVSVFLFGHHPFLLFLVSPLICDPFQNEIFTETCPSCGKYSFCVPWNDAKNPPTFSC